MRHRSLNEFLSGPAAARAQGPIAMIFAEDQSEVDSTLHHHLRLGFRQVLLLAPDEIVLEDGTEDLIDRIPHDVHAEGAVAAAVNRMSDALPAGCWIHYCFNAEYLYFPFCETRSVRDLLAFHAEERRDAMLTYVVDLYAGDLGQHPSGVDRGAALLDGAGYFAQPRKDAENGWQPLPRQMDFFGGLRWRFEEHVPPAQRRIDRISLFRSRPGLRLRPDFTFDDAEYNTYACPWHHNLTACICSFRAAKALRANPGSRDHVHDFRWRKSVTFAWHSQQLMDLGLMEPGQWF